MIHCVSLPTSTTLLLAKKQVKLTLANNNASMRKRRRIVAMVFHPKGQQVKKHNKSYRQAIPCVAAYIIGTNKIWLLDEQQSK